jgi:uncharacterized membrane protein
MFIIHKPKYLKMDIKDKYQLLLDRIEKLEKQQNLFKEDLSLIKSQAISILEDIDNQPENVSTQSVELDDQDIDLNDFVVKENDHEEESPELIKENDHEEESPELIKENDHEEESPELIKENDHEEESPELIKENDHEEESPELIQENDHEEESPELIQENDHEEESPELIKEEIPDTEMETVVEELDSTTVAVQKSIQYQEKLKSKYTQKAKQTPKKKKPAKKKFNTEEYIGQNIISKIGIAILIIGVSIGVKYSIDNNLLSPIARIISGYVWGLALFGVAIKLKKKYFKLSATVFSGSMALCYFTTFSAYNFYELLPQFVAFALMLVFTAIIVTAALKYRLEPIAAIGMVGAYAIPFLLSDGSGRVWILLSYITIINIGILYISIRQQWRVSTNLAIILSWIIFFSSWTLGDTDAMPFYLWMTFLVAYFATFYIAIYSQIINVEAKEFLFEHFTSLLNSFAFVALGLMIIQEFNLTVELAALFVLANVLLYFLHGVVHHRKFPEKLIIKNIIVQSSNLLMFISWIVLIQSIPNQEAQALPLISYMLLGGIFIAFYYSVNLIRLLKHDKLYDEIAKLLIVLNSVLYLAYTVTIANTYDLNDLNCLIYLFAQILFQFIVYLFITKKFPEMSQITNFVRAATGLLIPAIWLISLVYFFENKPDGISVFTTFLVVVAIFAVYYFIALHFILKAKDKSISVIDYMALLGNLIGFYLIGLLILAQYDLYDDYSGLFTFINALINLFVSYVLFKKFPFDKSAFKFLLIPSISFIFIAIAVEFETEMRIMLWAAEAAVVYALYRKNEFASFKYMSSIINVIVLISLYIFVVDRYFIIDPESLLKDSMFIFNRDFGVLAVAILTFGSIFYTSRKWVLESDLKRKRSRFNYILSPWIFAVLIFFAFFYEIGREFDICYFASISNQFVDKEVLSSSYNKSILDFKIIFTLNYIMLYTIILSTLGIKYLKNQGVAQFILLLDFVAIISFLAYNLNAFADLNATYLDPSLNEPFAASSYSILIRYFSYLFLVGQCIIFFKFFKKFKEVVNIGADQIFIFMNIATLIILSFEIIMWQEYFGVEEKYKTYLSVLWGAYAFALIFYGIKAKAKYLRIMAISIFAVTLLKLFVYDISDLPTLSKIILFLSIGSFLLVVSFLYFKFKNRLFGDSESDNYTEEDQEYEIDEGDDDTEEFDEENHNL